MPGRGAAPGRSRRRSSARARDGAPAPARRGPGAPRPALGHRRAWTATAASPADHRRAERDVDLAPVRRLEDVAVEHEMDGPREADDEPFPEVVVEIGLAGREAAVDA